MSEHDWLAERFGAHRTHLRAVAYLMPGSPRLRGNVAGLPWLGPN
jgi:hypothetical protein